MLESEFDRSLLAGFEGFVSVKRLQELQALGKLESIVPEVKGVYAVILPASLHPGFASESVGGHFKGKNPSVATPSQDTLESARGALRK